MIYLFLFLSIGIAPLQAPEYPEPAKGVNGVDGVNESKSGRLFIT
jgi:hypothetical protein